VSKHQQQGDSEIHEDSLLYFLANNAEIDAEEIYEVRRLRRQDLSLYAL